MRIDLQQSSKLASNWLSVSVVMVGVLLSGCDNRTVTVKPEDGGILPPPNPVIVAPKVKQPMEMPSGKKNWLDTQTLPVTTWYSQYHNGNCIGFSQFTIEASETLGSDVLRLTKRDVLEVAATSSTPLQRREIVLESLENADGKLLNYTEVSRLDGSTSESAAKVQRESLTIAKSENGKPTTSSSLPWPEGTWGPLGIILMLRQQPMQPDEIRKAAIFVSPLEKIAKVELKSRKWEMTPISGGLVSELLLVETQFTVEEQSAVTKNWVNKQGEIVKSVSQGGFAMFLCSSEDVDRIDGSIRAAQLIEGEVPVQATIEQLRPARVTFSIDSTSVDPFGLLSSKVNQKTKSLSALGATLTISRVTPNEPIPEGALQDPPDESHLSKFDSDASLLRSFLSEFPEASSDALSTASNLTGGVFQKIEKAVLSRSFATPTQAIQQRKGDCKAHSILLTAVLRERGIPARAASGLRILKAKDSDHLFAIYHMWVEAWVGDRWMPLDPFAGSIGVGADHIKFAECSLNEKNLIPVMLDVLQSMKQLTIAVKEK